MAAYPSGLPVGYVTLSIFDLIGDLGATGDGDDLPDVADVTLTVEMVPTAKMITYGGKGYRLRSYTWTGTSTLTAPDGTGSYALPSTDTLTQAGTGWQWQARISVAAGSTTTQLTTPAFALPVGGTVDLLPLIPLEAQSLDVSALVIIPPGTALPEQAGQAGKVLTTDGASASWSTPSAAADWSTLSGKPAAIGAGATAAAARAAIGAGTSDLVIGTTSGTAADAADVTTALAGKASSSHTHTATGISDSTTVGRSVLTASTATAARTALGLAAVAATGDAGDLSGDPLPDALLPDAATAGMKWNGTTFVAGRVTLFTGGSDAVPPTGLAAGDVWIREVP